MFKALILITCIILLSCCESSVEEAGNSRNKQSPDLPTVHFENDISEFSAKIFSGTGTLPEDTNIAKLKREISEVCGRHIIKSGLPGFIRDIDLNEPHRMEGRYIAKQVHPFFRLIGASALKENIPIEIWLGPQVLIEPCLYKLGYSGLQEVSRDRMTVLKSALYMGRKVYLITGAMEISWIYKFQLLYKIALKLYGIESDSLFLMSKTKDPDTYFKKLAEIWYYYSIGAYVARTPTAVKISYGRKLGHGRHFFYASFSNEEKQRLPFKRWKTLPRGSILCYLSEAGEEGDLAFLDTALADQLALPMYYVGYVLGKNKIQTLGHWSTAGSLTKDLQIGDIFIPDKIVGFDTLFQNESLNPSKSIRVDIPEFNLNNSSGIPIKKGGVLGSIFNIALEFKTLEETMQDEWGWAALDTDAYPLFQGFMHTNPGGKIISQYWITDLSLRELNNQVQTLANENRSSDAVRVSQIILRDMLSIRQIGCK